MNIKDRIKQPNICTEEQLVYLDELRLEGKTNMFGAGEYLEDDFCLTRSEANEVLGYWMDTFSKRHPNPKLYPLL